MGERQLGGHRTEGTWKVSSNLEGTVHPGGREFGQWVSLSQLDTANRTMKGWLLYGAALNEGRELFEGDREFGQWKVEALGQLALAVEPKDEQAAMWAAANPQDFQTFKKAVSCSPVTNSSDNG